MTIKEILLTVVRSFNTLGTTPPDNTAALATAQAAAKTAIDALAAKNAEDALSASEDTEVQTALNTISASTPPTPAALTAVVAAVPQG